MDKARYIQDKESTLYRDLEKANRKMKEIANWYDISNYELNAQDDKTILLMVKEVNNLYQGLNSLLQATSNFKISSNLNELITSEPLDLEGVVKCIFEKGINKEIEK